MNNEVAIAGLMQRARECSHKLANEANWLGLEAAIRAYGEACRAATLVPEGWKPVPVEPTEDMLYAAEVSKPRGYEELYAAMLAASPVPPAPALTEPMRAVLRNEKGAYQSEDELYAALCSAAGTAPATGEQKGCEYCDGTGDVHDRTGEWRGVCKCPAGAALSVPQAAPATGSVLTLDQFCKALEAYADAQYAAALQRASTDECKGWEMKVQARKFGEAEMDAHLRMNRDFGAHFGIYAAIKQARALAAKGETS